MVVAMVMAACASAPPWASDPPPRSTVAARWIAEDGTIVVLNLVAPVGTDAQDAREMAGGERADHPGARVIVRVFAATAGPERYVIGHVPVGTGAFVEASPPPSLIGLYDFPP